MKRCPYCAEFIADNSSQCEFCQSNLQDHTPLRKVADETNDKQEHRLNSSGWKIMLAVIMGIMVVLLAIDIWQRQDNPTSKTAEQNNIPAEKSTPDTHSQSNNGIDNSTTRPTVVDPSEYIFPDSDSRELKNSDFDGMTRRELKLARNEVFARHGFDFGDKPKVRWLREYFMPKSWYQPDKLYQNELNDIEKHNVDLISAQEERILENGKYIIRDSSTRYLTEDEVKNLSKSTLALARNEIRARNGYVFPDKPDSIVFKEYFESQPWYIPNPYFNSPFNEYEKANVDLIRQVERGEASVASSKSRDPMRPSIDGEWESSSGNGFVIRTYGEQLEVVFKGKWRDKTYQGKWISNNQFEFKSNELCTAIIADKNTIKVSAGDNLYVWSRKVSVNSH